MGIRNVRARIDAHRGAGARPAGGAIPRTSSYLMLRHPMSSIPVLAAVIQRNDRYLICKRPPHKRHANLWEFPGGKLESNESLLDAANRELQEELGVTAIKVGEPLVSLADPGSHFVIEFIPTTIRGEPTCLEHSELRWASLDELQSLPLAPTDRQFVEFALAQRLGPERAGLVQPHKPGQAPR